MSPNTITKKTTYRQIIKATSIFGGVQVFNILISIVRSKFIAVLLGPAGMGISGLLVSTMGLIGSITNFGLGTSAVRNVSVAAASQDTGKIRTTIAVLKRMVWITGVFGAFLTIILSPYLSELTFGNRDYTLAFIGISFALLLTQLSTGELVILQGLRKLKYLAKADMAGMILGLFISIPIYYKFGSQGIVPAIVISSFFSFFLNKFYASKIGVKNVSVSKEILRSEGFSMLKMGFMLSLSGLITVSASYILKLFIGRFGDLEQVGLYNAGFAIINTYVGMIFNAMVTDYYPRLSEVSSDNEKSKNVINSQAEIAILILAPILLVFLTFVDYAVILLYSDEFLGVNEMLHWAALGMFFKTVSWSVGFIILAKGASKLFIWNELIGNIYLLLINLLGFYFLGLYGLGISFFIGYVIFFGQIYFVARIYYGFKFENEVYKIFLIQFVLGVICFVVMEFLAAPYSYFVGVLLSSISIGYSYIELNKRLDIKQIIQKFINRKN